ncbi:unnamed protein product [Calypogeia fissa]
MQPPILLHLNMAEVTPRGHPCPLRTSDYLSLGSSRVLTTFLSSSVLSCKMSVRPRTYDFVTSLYPPSATCFPGTRNKSLRVLHKFQSLQIFEIHSSNLRVATCYQLTRGDGEHRSFLIRPTAEADAKSFRTSSSSRDSREGGISFNCRSERTTEEEGEKWTQSTHAQLVIPPQIIPSSVQQDVGMACLVLVGAFIWVRLFDFFTSNHILGQKSSRKIVHITSGLLYMLCWPFFSRSKWAPFIAGLVPLANGIRLLIYGFELLKDDGLVKSMSRSGESRELLRGPLFYVMVLYFSTIFFWRQSPVGMVALSMMCGGDGIADIMGRKFGSKKLPYNNNKSFAGSIAMFLFGFLVSSMCVYYFTLFGFFKLDLYSTASRLALISFLATIVESLPITTQLDDNFTVPATSFLLGIVLFPSLS